MITFFAADACFRVKAPGRSHPFTTAAGSCQTRDSALRRGRHAATVIAISTSTATAGKTSRAVSGSINEVTLPFSGLRTGYARNRRAEYASTTHVVRERHRIASRGISGAAYQGSTYGDARRYTVSAAATTGSGPWSGSRPAATSIATTATT